MAGGIATGRRAHDGWWYCDTCWRMWDRWWDDWVQTCVNTLALNVNK